MTKILVIGDFHGKFPAKFRKIIKTEKINLVLSTGDYGGSDRLLKIIFKYFYQNCWEKVGLKKARVFVKEDYESGKKIINDLGKLDVPVFAVDGNWDFEGKGRKERNAGLKLEKYSDIMKEINNISFLNKRHKKFGKLNILGFGGYVVASIYLTKDGPFEDLKDRKKQKIKHDRLRKQLMKKGKKGIDIFLSHYPPYGMYDKVRYKGKNPMNRKHVGFKPYTEFIKRFKPKVFVFGHMHEYQGKKKLGDTIVVATGSAKEGKAAIIEITEGKDQRKKENDKKISVRFVK